MTTPLALPQTREGVAHFIKAIERDLQRLVESFSQHREPLIEYLGATLPALPIDEKAQAQRLLEHWRGLSVPHDLTSTLPWWDMRLGAERDAIPASADLLAPIVSDTVGELSHAWGLTAEHGVHGHVDAVLVLGGLVTADFARPEFLSSLLASGLEADHIVGLAGHRALAAWELEHPDVATATTEAAALARGFTCAGIQNYMLAVAPNVGGRRATTASSVDWWLAQHPDLRGSGRVATVTSSIYRVRNQIDVLTLTHGCQVATASLAGRPRLWRSQFYLQEIKAAADGLALLRAWALS